MCILVLVDAAVVVAEILLDMHAIRSQSISREYICSKQYLNKTAWTHQNNE